MHLCDYSTVKYFCSNPVNQFCMLGLENVASLCYKDIPEGQE